MSIILRIAVYDHPGVVDRITGIIRRNGWNISGINAGEMDQGVSKVNILLRQRDVDIRLIGNHLSSLDCVQSWEVCSPESHFIRELFAFTIREDALPEPQPTGMRIVDRQGPLLFGEYTGSPGEVDALIHRLEGKLLDCARTGVLSIDKGGDPA